MKADPFTSGFQQVDIPPQSFDFACPVCRSPLEIVGPDEARCPQDGRLYSKIEGIWRCLPFERLDYFSQFMQEYQTVRQGEGRGSADPAYYRALPFTDLTGWWRRHWKIRANSFQAFIRNILQPFEKENSRPLKALDLGAGNGWLSYRLASRGHLVAALDLLTNAFDGLGAAVHYDTPFTAVQAEFDCLPFTSAQVDLIVFNAALHYSTNYARTLVEALRVLKPGGLLAIIDSPLYRDPGSGSQMVREREAQFERQYGFRSNSISSENFLTFQRLAALETELGINWDFVAPNYGVRWSLRPWLARLRGWREPASFLIVTGRRKG